MGWGGTKWIKIKECFVSSCCKIRRLMNVNTILLSYMHHDHKRRKTSNVGKAYAYCPNGQGNLKGNQKISYCSLRKFT